MAKRKKKKKPESLLSKLKQQFKKQSPVLLFCLGIVVIMIAYYWMYNQDFFNNYINKPVLKFYAILGSGLLNIFGFGTTVSESFVSNPDFSLNIGKGCDAISPTILILAAILTFPIAFKLKIRGLIIAPIAIMILNLIRIASLFLIGLYAPDFFEIMHVEIWQTVFIIFCLVGWLYWLIWANKQQNA